MSSESVLSWNYAAFVGGLQDPSTKQYQNRRAIFKLVNELRSNGLQGEIDIPQIAVVGSQSVGKSSLIESIAGITLPRSQGTCTRCPIECRLSRSTSPWSCEVFLRRAGQPMEEPFGSPFEDRLQVEERIRRAQLAILNPSTTAEEFLGSLGSKKTAMRNELSFSDDLISVRISGIHEDDLSFVDLPGVISSVRDDGNDTDIEAVKNLVLRVIERPSCLILLVVSGETDLENQGARRLVSEVDPDRIRTIPVLTKPDRIANGEHDRWIRILSNGQDRYKHGWFSVKQRDQLQLQKGISWEDARQNERDFFARNYPWSKLDREFKSRLGTFSLTRALGAKLFDLISKSLPRLRNEVEERVLNIRHEINSLPTKPIGDPVAMIWSLVDDFKRDVDKLVKGNPQAGQTGLVQTFRKSKEEFRGAIRNQAPVFKLLNKPTQENNSYHEPPKSPVRSLDSIFLEETPDTIEECTTIYMDEVLGFAKDARTRELPDNYPYAVTEHYVALFTKRWPLPAQKLFETTERQFLRILRDLVNHHFSIFAPGELDAAVMRTVLEQLKRCSTSTQEKMKQIIALEQEEPTTLNEDILINKKREFQAKFKEARNVHLVGPSSSISTSTIQQIVDYAGRYGLHVTRDGLLRSLPWDESETAIEIMSEVCAYYEVAFRRFIDTIPMIIDLELLKGFSRTLNSALFQGLGLGEDIAARCAAFLREDPEVVSSRKMLQELLERLLAALTNLQNIPGAGSTSGSENGDESPPAATRNDDHPRTPQTPELHGFDSPYQPGTPFERPATPEGYIPPPSSYSISSGFVVHPTNELGISVADPIEEPIRPALGQSSNKKKKGKNKKI